MFMIGYYISGLEVEISSHFEKNLVLNFKGTKWTANLQVAIIKNKYIILTAWLPPAPELPPEGAAVAADPPDDEPPTFAN